MITTAELKSHTKADLSAMAKRLGVEVNSRMKKDDLVAIVAKGNRSSSRAASGKSPAKAASRSAKPKAAKKIAVKASPVSKKLAATKSPKAKPAGRSRVKAGVNGAAAKSAAADAAKLGVTKSASGGSPMNGKPRSAKAVKKPAGAKATAATGSKSPSPAAPRAASTKPKKLVARKEPPKKAVAQKSTTSPRVLKQIRELQLQKESNKDIAFRPTLVRPPGAAEPIWEREPQSDRVALFVRDAYWMHAAWDITRGAIERARAAMAEQWHGAKPVLRLLRLDDSGAASTSETVERDIEIHGGLRNWYIEWTGQAARFRILVGYLAPNGRFHMVVKSNIVKTPDAGSDEAVDEHWADSGPDSERIFALSGGYDKEQETGEMKDMLQQRLHREMGPPALAKLGAGAGAEGPFRRRGDFHFDMNVELVIYGSTTADCYLTLSGEPVSLRPDGTFVMRMPFPDKRQVLPAVACSRDGTQQRTIVVAVERNTKVMEPLESERISNE